MINEKRTKNVSIGPPTIKQFHIKIKKDEIISSFLHTALPTRCSVLYRDFLFWRYKSDVFAHAKVMLFASLIMMLLPMVAMMWCLPTTPSGVTSFTQYTSLPKATSLARKGKHRSADLLYRRSPFRALFFPNQLCFRFVSLVIILSFLLCKAHVFHLKV